ncbi:MAG: hypothetical protein AAF628_21495 [Planctomycetota bacterium]
MGRTGPLSERAWHAAAAVGVALVLLWRCSDAFAHPIAFGEDWDQLLVANAWHGPGADLLQPYAGYVSLGPRLIAAAAAGLPLTWQPHVFALGAGLVAILVLSWLAAPRFAAWLPAAPLRALLCVLLALIPVGNHALYSAAMYTSTHMLLALVLWSCAPAPRRLVVELSLATVCVWSHPASLALLPFWGLRAWLEPGASRRFFGGLVAGGLVYLAAGIQLGEASRSLASLPRFLGTAVGSWTLAGETRALIGLPWTTYLILPGVALAIAARSRAVPAPTRRAALTLGLAATTVAAAMVAGRAGTQGGLLFQPRYLYVTALMSFLAIAMPLLSLAQAAGPRPLRLAAAALAIHVACLLPGTQHRYRTSPVVGDRVAAFLAEVAPWVAADGPPGERRALAIPGRHLVLRRPARP